MIESSTKYNVDVLTGAYLNETPPDPSVHLSAGISCNTIDDITDCINNRLVSHIVSAAALYLSDH